MTPKTLGQRCISALLSAPQTVNDDDDDSIIADCAAEQASDGKRNNAVNKLLTRSASISLPVKSPPPPPEPPPKRGEQSSLSNVSDYHTAAAVDETLSSGSGDDDIPQMLDWDGHANSLDVDFDFADSSNAHATGESTQVTPTHAFDHDLHLLLSDLSDDGIVDVPVALLRHRTNCNDGPSAHLDAGAAATTADDGNKLFDYAAFSEKRPCRMRLVAADGNKFSPVGHGFLRLKDTDGNVQEAFCCHAPGIPCAIISPNSFFRGLAKHLCAGCILQTHNRTGNFTFAVKHRVTSSKDMQLSGMQVGGLCCTAPLILPRQRHLQPCELVDCSVAEHELHRLLREPHLAAHALKADAERLLWHQRLGHPSDHCLFNAHKHVDGVPQFKHHDGVLDQCPICVAAKLTKSNAGHEDSRRADAAFQGLSVDFGFIGQSSDNSKRVSDYVGINGETCYLLIADHFTGMLCGQTRVSKAPPLNCLRRFLRDNASPTMQDKHVRLDQGGELCKSPEVRALFLQHGHVIEPTGADASHQNVPVERPHRTIANALRCMLNGSGLPVKFWPCAFSHCLRIKNAAPSRDREQSPVLMVTGKKENFHALRTFGCRVWVRPPGKRKAKLKNHSRKGIFLGYLPRATKNTLWHDVESKRVKIAYHVRFDEAMSDMDYESLPPNIRHLHRTQQGTPLEVSDDDELTNPPDFLDFADAPFLDVDEKRVETPRATRREHLGSHVDATEEEPICSLEDAKEAFRNLRRRKATSFNITLAKEPLPDATTRHRWRVEHEWDTTENDFGADADENTGQLLLDSEVMESMHRLIADRFGTSVLNVDDALMQELPSDDLPVCAVHDEHMTSEECNLPAFARRRLKKIVTWPQWEAAEHRQLDHFWDLRMWGKPCQAPKGASIVHDHWQRRVKTNGKRRARCCCDGSPSRAPQLHEACAKTHASCASQPGMRIFFALCALKNLIVCLGDAADAFAHSPAPSKPTFITIGDEFHDWWLKRFGEDLPRHLVLPVLHALQGHPEAAKLWEDHITKISHDLGFESAIHETNVYEATIDGHAMLLCRQVDDFAIGAPTQQVADAVFDRIGAKLKLPSESVVPFEKEGLTKVCNGVNALQTWDCIKLSAQSCIERVMLSHKWGTPTASLSESGRSREPLPPHDLSTLCNATGPEEHAVEHAELETQEGFRYRTLLGELLHAHVIGRLDVGYAITAMAKFANRPAKMHCLRLKGIAKHLRRTADWGLHFWRSEPQMALPDIPIKMPDDAMDVDFPKFSLHDMVGFVDAAHANDLIKRRSTTGHAFVFAGAAVACRSAAQSIAATSSAEAEFLAAVSAAKVAKYLRNVLFQLRSLSPKPTILFEDDASAIQMVNAKQPTERSRHIDMQCFAIQDWKQQGAILMQHAPGVLNPSDGLSKPLGWTLHSRHARRLMGHCGPSS